VNVGYIRHATDIMDQHIDKWDVRMNAGGNFWHGEADGGRLELKYSPLCCPHVHK
jgi:hypothetical protein